MGCSCLKNDLKLNELNITEEKWEKWMCKSCNKSTANEQAWKRTK